MSTQTESDLLSQIKAWACDPRAIFYSLRGKHGNFLIFPEEVVGKTDSELAAFLIERSMPESAATYPK